ncbi:MAG: FKBP-type peptidyl-prolyl cis-trans isomerase [Bacteroidales bacterium]|nr:FKBP-type peptidyl-prolyl cis-trans isomerase [Bacteroidales bacterium]
MTDKEKASYALGANNGEQFKNLGLDIDANVFLQGLKDAMAGQNKFSTDEMQAAFGLLDSMVRANQDKMLKEEKAAGAAFLAKNKTQPGVKETPSGLQYKVVREGNGKKPNATDKVKVHYKGTLLDGTVFDSSYDRNEPIVFPLGNVIAGWTEGLQLMSEGSKYILYIPSDLGYGDRGAQTIKPGATLIFEVELIEVNPAQ